MDTKTRKKSYSDLETIVTTSLSDPKSYWDAKFTFPPIPESIPSAREGSEAPEVVSQVDVSKDEKVAQDVKTLFDASPVDTLVPAPPAYFLVDSKGQTQALYIAPISTPSESSSVVNFKGGVSPVTPPSSGGWWSSLGEGKRVLGMRKSMCLAVMAGVCAMVLGLLITILLVTRPKDSHGNPNSSGPDEASSASFFATQALLTKGDSGPFLAASNLAAMNWTIGGQSYVGVFYQSAATSGAALMVSIKNEVSQQWTTVNISSSAATTRLDVLTGTPLAAATNNGLWKLYYLTSGMTIAEIYATDPLSASGWSQGDFAKKLGSPEVAPNSRLGAMWQLCDDCDDALFVSW